MILIRSLTLVLVGWTVSCCAAGPTNVVIRASDFGNVYVCNGCSRNVQREESGVIEAGDIQGVVRYPTAPIGGSVIDAELVFSTYSTAPPPELDIYGISRGGASVTYPDASAGTVLGSLQLPPLNPPSLMFDVTDFLSHSPVPYIGFNFRNSGGLAAIATPTLSVTFIPEPTAALLLLGMLGCGWRRRR
jgi:hypothetical protein